VRVGEGVDERKAEERRYHSHSTIVDEGPLPSPRARTTTHQTEAADGSISINFPSNRFPRSTFQKREKDNEDKAHLHCLLIRIAQLLPGRWQIRLTPPQLQLPRLLELDFREVLLVPGRLLLEASFPSSGGRDFGLGEGARVEAGNEIQERWAEEDLGQFQKGKKGEVKCRGRIGRNACSLGPVCPTISQREVGASFQVLSRQIDHQVVLQPVHRAAESASTPSRPTLFVCRTATRKRMSKLTF
jgi:hypothetical protein